MSKKKNLERAIVLGLILSTGVYGNVLAADPVGIGIDQFKGDAKNGVITVNEDTIVKGTGVYGPDVSSDSGQGGNAEVLKNSLFYRDGELLNLTISAGDGVQLTFHNVNMLSPHIVRNGDGNGADIIILDNKENVDKTFAGISVTGIIEGNSLTVNSGGRGIYTGVDNTKYPVIDNNNPFYGVKIDVINGFEINSASDGIFNEGDSESDVTITAGSVYIENTDRNGIYNAGQSTDAGNNVTVSALDGNIVIKSHGIGDDQASVKNKTEGSTTLKADVGSIMLTSKSNGIYATKGSTTLNSSAGNSIYAGDIVENVAGTIEYGTKSAIHAFGGGKGENVTNVNLTTGKENYLLGAVYATGRAEKQEGKPEDPNKYDTNVMLSGGTNKVYSYTEIAGAGDINTTEDVIDGETNKFKDKRFISALYAEDGANIELTGENTVGTWAKSTDANTLERTVWAYSSDDKIGSSISFDGAVQIGTDSYSSSPNSADVAIAAGTATDLTKDKVDGFVNDPNAKRSTVTIEYDDFKNAEGNYAGSSYISGDILSAYAGQVDIKGKSADVGIKITGNLLAGNNGILNVDLGKGGVLLGRADDYGDAGVVNNGQAGEGNEHQEFFDPAFSSTIHKGGRVDLGMGAGSTWFVTGQSWITTIDTTKAKGDAENERAKVDLVTEYKDKDGSDIAAHALTVYEFKGDADFLMSLSGNRADTDMLYMKHADGNYRIMLDKDITTSDINQDYATGENYSGLRFATVGADSDVTFTVGSYDNGGAFNVEYEVGKDVYGSDETAHENEAYNGSKLDGGKPGDDMVDNFFGNNGEPVSDETGNEGAISTASANSIMLMSEEPETLAEETQANDTNAYNAINHKIIAVKGTELNDTGKTILNMSRANYSNAIYMDRLNKRLGEARYINSEEDEGMWVRIRHDRIGKDAAYRSQNTMYELGYDQKQECDNGERRVGMAIDYMHGDTGYDQIAGKGEIDRYGLWLYDTWMGDKGHYADYVAKWGHLSNDFEVYTMQNGDKVTGDYSNNVFSVSAEYGRKKDIGNDWYFEPQVQAQLARVTGADYTTNQGTKVSVDGINSLIGRAGFRLGKDFGEEKQSTVYIKADVLHEFLGDQDVRVLDKSSDNKWAGISYENEGTWYDVGFGFATQMSKNSYAFMDFEKSFGNDNDETYQINVGMQWSF